MSEFVEQCDVLIRGGQVIDGTGQPARLADVAITGDRIVALGALNVERAEHVIAFYTTLKNIYGREKGLRDGNREKLG
mgnify:CR=1 FL=1